MVHRKVERGIMKKFKMYGMTPEALIIESGIYALSVLNREKKSGYVNKTRFCQNGHVVNEEEIKETINKNLEILRRNNE